MMWPNRMRSGILLESSSSAAKRSIRLGGAFACDRRAAAAVEFGLISLPFLALLGAIIQIAFSMWANQNFDFLFQETARTVFTGQFQGENQGVTDSTALLSALRNRMCNGQQTLFDCSGVRFDVRLGTNFASSSPATIVDPATRDWAAGFGTNYSCAGPGKIVIITAAAKFPVFFDLLNAGFARFADGSTLLQSTAVFRTEPYTSAGSSPC